MTTGDNEPIALDPPFRVKLRNGQAAAVTHYVSDPAPWELMGLLSNGERALWTRHGRFDPEADHGLDITLAVTPDGRLAKFQSIEKVTKGGQP